MWARDFLPDTLNSSLGYGRYMTFGYSAPIVDPDGIAESIDRTARNLLRAISGAREKARSAS
jgi:hypothetical protein